MIIDSSAMIAILRNEPEAQSCAEAIEKATIRRISAATFVETAIVLDNAKNAVISRRFDQFIKDASILVEAVSAAQAELARAAYKDFGKNSGHPAKLNFGDCFSYALAKAINEPLLYIGNDFTHTDVESARKSN